MTGAIQELVLAEAPRCWDRRRSHRVELVPGLPVPVAELGMGRMVLVSLGGTTIEGTHRPSLGHRYPVHLAYGGHEAELTVAFYETVIRELFYGADGRSRILYRSRGRFVDPTVAALNLVYRILREHWQPGDGL